MADSHDLVAMMSVPTVQLKKKKNKNKTKNPEEKHIMVGCTCFIFTSAFFKWAKLRVSLVVIHGRSNS